MRGERDLRGLLSDIDRRGYPAYKQLRGAYELGDIALAVTHVQGDPFAAPSSLVACVPAATARLASGLVDAPHRRLAVEDLLVRRLARELARASFRVRGSGKSGLLGCGHPGPEVLARSTCEVSPGGAVTLRLEAGLPAHGRTVDGAAADRLLCELVPACARRAACGADLAAEAQAAADLADDQHFVREELARRDLVAFVADGSVLPRASGVSSAPLAGALPFCSPDTLAVTLDLPHRGPMRGMGVPRGVTLVVGGGYHGKSTLLRALQEGVYDHVAGDGRELVLTDATAMKLRAEDGRAVHATDISPFVRGLPSGADTSSFSTEDASGSTSQAAATAEALGAGCRALLIDEDTSATNFMVRDALMQAVVSRGHEPITPFVERVRDLWERAGVSSVIVAGSSGAFFSVADVVIQMDAYEAHDVTERVREVCRERAAAPTPRAPGFALPAPARVVQVAPTAALRADASAGGRGRGARTPRDAAARPLKVRSQGRDALSVGEGSADVRLVEQLVDPEQVAACARLVRLAIERGLMDGCRAPAQAADALLMLLDVDGWDALDAHGHAPCGLARPRREELAACLARWRVR